MKLISLTQGQHAIVDDDDFETLSQYKWHARRSKGKPFSCSRAVTIDGKFHLILMHRFIMNITDRKIQVDHINHNPLDNRKSNLRLCTNSENCKNRRPARGSSSKYLGVRFRKERKTWEAGISVNGKNIYLGNFKVEEDAARAYDEAAKKYHKEFSNPNFK